MSNVTSGPAFSRIEGLLDENSFVEIMSEVTSRSTDFNVNKDATPGDGVVVGHGQIDGNLVFVYSQNPSVLGGTIGEKHAEKIRKAYEMAVRFGAPLVGIIDCGGVRLQESFDALSGLGEIIKTASETSGIVPVISCVVGNCGGGMDIVAGLGDFIFMTEKAGMFINSPDAITGNKSEKVDTSGAKFQSETAGTCDVFADENELFDNVRKLVALIPANNLEGVRVDDSADDMNRASAAVSSSASPVQIATDLADNGCVFEVRKNFASDMTTGFMKLNGATIGFVGNNGAEDNTITADGALKASEFIKFLDAFDIPLLTLTNANGFKRTIDDEKNLLRALTALTAALADSDIPKINLITKEAFGSSYMVMNSKALGADFVYALSDSDMGIMDAEKAAMVICPDGSADEINAVKAEFEAVQSGTVNAARRGLVDRIVAPVDARKYLIDGFELAYTKRAKESLKKHSTR